MLSLTPIGTWKHIKHTPLLTSYTHISRTHIVKNLKIGTKKFKKNSNS